jgi:3-hydroxyacyl-CoA dehydrogenase/enoyl-CoA hydratase/3-hydroxybutyryl-CoA epimerase/3-hydroxyacyl-CoA dehydrogenase/enoyl-CoA hydratase/3-hydroxybutyryl-CoA epimerase/enoyl-CoA isomerase
LASDLPHPSVNDPARGLEHVARLIQWNQLDQQTSGIEASRHIIRTAGIVGAGMMGVAIAAVHVRRELPIVITDADAAVLAAAPARIVEELSTHLSESDARRAVERLVRLADSDAAFGECDLVLESVIEDLAVKQALYRRLEPHLKPWAILASNTSTIPISRLAGTLGEPGRFCGIHFFHPVRERPLTEIIRGTATSDATIAAAVGYAKRIEKLPIVVGDGPGFLVNRLLVPYMNEAMQMLLEGTPLDAIEEAALRFGMAMGPFQLLDEIGLETALRGGIVVYQAFPERIVASPLLVAMIKAGRGGRKANAGFYSYRVGPGGELIRHRDPAVERIVAKWSRPGEPQSQERITDRLFLPMLLEATRILEEGRVRDPRTFDLGVLLGLGFPRERGGLLYWADTVGAANLVERLLPLASLGERFMSPPLLEEFAQHGGQFYTE